jgi:hypothetical protein
MFSKQELAVIHKALSEVMIKGAEAPAMAALMQKVFDAHNASNKKEGSKSE